MPPRNVTIEGGGEVVVDFLSFSTSGQTFPGISVRASFRYDARTQTAKLYVEGIEEDGTILFEFEKEM